MLNRRIAVLNHKGGVGKTTTCLNLACYLSSRGFRVLAIDLDPQSHLTVSLGVRDSSIRGVDAVLFDQQPIQSILQPVRENLQLIPCGMRLGEIEKLASKGKSQVELLNKALKEIEASFDCLLIDCPPNSGMLNFNALYAVDEVLIPVSSDYLALQGLSQLLKTLKSAERFMNKSLKMEIVLTRFNGRRRLSLQVKDKLERYFHEQLISTPIRENVSLAESPSFGKSIFEYSPKSNGAMDYAQMAEQLLQRG